jgi:hypothetical protein
LLLRKARAFNGRVLTHIAPLAHRQESLLGILHWFERQGSAIWADPGFAYFHQKKAKWWSELIRQPRWIKGKILS